MNAFIKIAFLGAAIFTASLVRGDIIFNVNFENPPHAVGSQAANGSPPYYVTSGGFGIANVPEFGSQGASTTASGSGNSMLFDSGTTYTYGLHSISWDWIQYSYSDVFSPDSAVNMGPSELNLAHSQGSIALSQELGLLTPYSGAYSTGTVYSYLFLIDLDTDAYDFWINNTAVLTGQAFMEPASLSSVTFNAPWQSDHAIDNFRWEIVPEPSTISLLMVGVLGALFRRMTGSKKFCR